MPLPFCVLFPRPRVGKSSWTGMRGIRAEAPVKEPEPVHSGILGLPGAVAAVFATAAFPNHSPVARGVTVSSFSFFVRCIRRLAFGY